MFSKAQFLYRLSNAPEDQSEMVCQLTYTLSGGPAMEALHQIVLEQFIQNTNHDVARSLKQFHESARPAPDKET